VAPRRLVEVVLPFLAKEDLTRGGTWWTGRSGEMENDPEAPAHPLADGDTTASIPSSYSRSLAHQRIVLRSCSARAAPIAVFTCFRSSGGGRTAFIPRASIHSSRHQPFV
jgi:hypothetical protein